MRARIKRSEGVLFSKSEQRSDREGGTETNKETSGYLVFDARQGDEIRDTDTLLPVCVTKGAGPMPLLVSLGLRPPPSDDTTHRRCRMHSEAVCFVSVTMASINRPPATATAWLNLRDEGLGEGGNRAGWRE